MSFYPYNPYHNILIHFDEIFNPSIVCPKCGAEIILPAGESVDLDVVRAVNSNHMAGSHHSGPEDFESEGVY